MSLLLVLLPYTTRVFPPLCVVAAALWSLGPRGSHVELRLAIFVAAFVLLRDALTPAGLWRFGAAGGVFWLRLPADASLLLVLGAASALLVPLMAWAEPSLAGHVASRLALTGPRGGGAVKSGAWGVLGAAAIAAPFALAARGVPLAARGGAVPLALQPALLAFSVLGNAYEEALFRGFLQGHLLAGGAAPARAALASALVFCLGHVFLSATVSDVGWPLLAFTLYEGGVAAALRARHGLVAAAVAHGLGIWAIASGLF